MGAWFGTQDWFYQVPQLIAFEDLAGFDKARRDAAADTQVVEARSVV